MLSTLRRTTSAPLETHTWILREPGPGGDCVVIDPGLDHAALAELLDETGWMPQAVLCTHGHFDHIGGAAVLQRRYGVPVYLSAADLKLARLSNFMLTAFRHPQRVELPSFTLLAAGERRAIEVAGRRFVFDPLPGHTPGSAVIAVDGLLFSGDSLYARRIALSTLPGEDHEQLRRSLRGLLGRLAPGTTVLPGHGDSATVAEIVDRNTALAAFLAEPEAVPA